MRPALAVYVDHKWADRFEIAGPGVAEAAVKAEFGDDWPATGGTLREATVLDGSHGRGASGWLPVIEWMFDAASKGLAWMIAVEIAREVREAIRVARSESASTVDPETRVLVSRGLAVVLACAHVFEDTEEREDLRLEVAQEPTILSGNEPSEISYTGLEPWIVVVVNESLTRRYVLAVSPTGAVLGCFSLEMDQWERMFYRSAPAD